LSFGQLDLFSGCICGVACCLGGLSRISHSASHLAKLNKKHHHLENANNKAERKRAGGVLGKPSRPKNFSV